MHRSTTTLTTLAAAAVMVAGPLALTTTTAQAADTSERRAAAYAVKAKVNKSVVTVGEDVVKVRGKVTPRAAGAKVLLQQRKEGKNRWKGSGKTTIKRNGTFVLKDKPSLAGSREYRVLKPAGQGLKKGTSPVLTVDVYAWEKLGRKTPGAMSNVATLATSLIGTASYWPSLMVTEPGKPAFVEFTLGRLCTDLRTTYALDDRSETGSIRRRQAPRRRCHQGRPGPRRRPGRRVDHRPDRRVPPALRAHLHRVPGLEAGRRDPRGPLHEVAMSRRRRQS